uniref:Putative lectin/glucanase superfamily protein n=1 Tax=viral metagenome TaxID=1070528 RepID=A0A6M3LAS4_9ZZZZ
MNLLTLPKSLSSYNPIPNGCLLYLPLWNPGLSGSTFKSIDPYGHLCTVTGALYGSTGRTFDGADDLINCGSGASLDDIFDTGGTYLAWINPSSDGEGDKGRVIEKANPSFFTTSEATGKVKMSFAQLFSTLYGEWETTATEVTIGTRTFVAVTYNSSSVANNPIMYIDGVVKTVGSGLTEVSTPDGTRTSDAASDLIIGNNVGGTRSYAGIIETTWAYNRILSAGEIEHIRQVTK